MTRPRNIKVFVADDSIELAQLKKRMRRQVRLVFDGLRG